MHYRTNSELPPDLREELPEEAQNLYRETFNKNYPKSRDKIVSDSEGLARQAAWKAVREVFVVKDGVWRKNLGDGDTDARSIHNRGGSIQE